MTLKQFNLDQFTGTTKYYKHWLGLLYTDGVQYVAKQGKAYWLIDAIAGWQLDPKIKRDPMLRQIQFWKLKVNDNNSAMLICERDAGNVAVTQEIERTNFPLPEIEFYLTQKVLMLPSEY
ncbi:DUF6876 family protein [Myxosarcina sp. GI1(2024)]